MQGDNSDYAKMQARKRAIDTLSHYLRMGLESKGYQWNSDNQTEVTEIVDSIIDAAKP